MLELSAREQKLRYEKPWKAIAFFCIPPVLIMVIQGLYNIFDKELALTFATGDLMYDPWYVATYNAWKGYVGAQQVTSIPIDQMKSYINIATQYAAQIYNLLWSFSIMIGLGCALNFSMAFGRRDKRKMQEIAGNGFILTIILSIIVAFVIFFLVYPPFNAVFITSQMGSKYNPITEQLAWEYTYPMLIAVPFMFLSYYFVSLIRSEGRMYWTIASIVTSIFINCGAAVFFMKVCHLGMVGAMLGTVLSWIIQVIWGFIIVFKLKGSQSAFRWKDVIAIKGDNIITFTKAGFPNFIANGALVITSYVATTLVVKIPNQEITGSDLSIIQQLIAALTPWMTLIISAGAGLTQGSRTIIAYNFGAEKYNRIWQILKRSSVLLFLWFTLVFMFVIIFAKEMLLIFAFPPQYADKYRWWLTIWFMNYPLCAITYICLTLFQGINKSFLGTFTNSLRSLLVVLPCIGVGYAVSLATGNGIFYFVFAGCNDLVCAFILIPILYHYWRKYKGKLVDKPDHLEVVKKTLPEL